MVVDKVKEREIVLLTNHLDFSATTISAIYKHRWQIELFFKARKKNLKVKTFIGTTENALYTQIWTAVRLLILSYKPDTVSYCLGHLKLIFLKRMPMPWWDNGPRRKAEDPGCGRNCIPRKSKGYNPSLVFHKPF
jgi:hypothetical protein